MAYKPAFKRFQAPGATVLTRKHDKKREIATSPLPFWLGHVFGCEDVGHGDGATRRIGEGSVAWWGIVEEIFSLINRSVSTATELASSLSISLAPTTIILMGDDSPVKWMIHGPNKEKRIQVCALRCFRAGIDSAIASVLR